MLFSEDLEPWELDDLGFPGSDQKTFIAPPPKGTKYRVYQANRNDDIF